MCNCVSIYNWDTQLIFNIPLLGIQAIDQLSSSLINIRAAECEDKNGKEDLHQRSEPYVRQLEIRAGFCVQVGQDSAEVPCELEEAV